MPSRRSATATSRGPSHSAPYGHACLHCFKAKCRCVSREDGDGCERCHRLQKTCHSSEAIRKRGKSKTGAVGTAGTSSDRERVAHIEEKLDSLMTLLQTVTKTPSAASALRETVLETGRQQELPQLQKADTPVSLVSPAADAAIPADVAPEAPVLYESLSREALERALNIFRLTLLPFCPFLWFPPDTTASGLQRHRPFLMRCIVAVTTTLVRDKVAQGQAMKEVLAKEMVVENHSTIDLLLGLLVYIAWGTDPMVSRSGTLSRLVLLAQSIICDLRWNKPLPADQHMLTTYTSNKGDVEVKGSQTGTEEDTVSHGPDGDDNDDSAPPADALLEQQRSVLGCFLITSAISVYFAQIDGMRWTPHMDDALKAVEAHGAADPLAFSGDAVLAHQVRLQQIVQRAVHAREHGAALPLYITQAFHANLDELRAAQPPVLPHSLSGTIFAIHGHYIELSLNEMTFSACSPGNDDDRDSRLACYWRSVHAIRALCEALLDCVPAHAFGGISFMIWAQLARAIVTLVRLATLPDLDSHAVRSVVDPLDVLDRFAERSKSAAAGLGRGLWRGPQQQHDDIFGRVAQLARVLRATVAARLESVTLQISDNDGPQWPMVESVIGHTTDGWGDIWLEGMFPRF
ncbi:hypothetical protein SEUCBS139899_003262 [Sporothrix eucalyptigena]